MQLASPDNLIPALQSIPTNVLTVIATSRLEQLNVAVARRELRNRPHTHVIAARRNLFVDQIQAVASKQFLRPVAKSPYADAQLTPATEPVERRDIYVGRGRTYVPATVTKDTASRARFLEFLYMDHSAAWPYTWPADPTMSRSAEQPYESHRIPPKHAPYAESLGAGSVSDTDRFVDMYM
jgi:hypothetical protein